jgi:hypothetical protein
MTGKISEDPDVGSLAGSEQMPIVVGGANKRTTPAEIAAYVASLAQTLTSKAIDAASNEISNLAVSMFAAGVVDTDAALTANSDTRIATQKAVRSYVAAYIAAQDVEIFKGSIDCSANPNFPAADAGHVYRVSIAGKIGGASGAVVEAGDRLECVVDGSASGTLAAVGANWVISQVNIDGAVVGPASATSGRIATFNGTSGKLIQDGGAAISTDGTFASNSDAKVPTEKAVATYVAAHAGGGTAPKAFRVTKNNVNQTGVASGVATQLTWSTEDLDEGGYFASNAWTPPAGKVELQLSVLFPGANQIAGNTSIARILKNGSPLANFVCTHYAANAQMTAPVSVSDVASGTDVYTTDVVIATNTSTGTVTGALAYTYFSGMVFPS